MRTLIIGIGNPILTDDSAGIHVARAVRDLLSVDELSGDRNRMPGGAGSPSQQVEVIELYAGGIRLMEAMSGYERVMIIDAMVTGLACPGTVHRPLVSDILSTRNVACTHDMNLPTALEMGKILGLHLPCCVQLWGIEAADVETFCEDVTEEVAKAIPVVVKEVMEELRHRSFTDRKELV